MRPLGLWRTRPSHPPHRPTIESSSKFQQAVGNINAGNFGPAIDALSSLDTLDCRSALVKFYLSLAFDHDDNKKYNAEEYLHSALGCNDAKDVLPRWSQNHPEILKYLVEFADSRINQADVLAETIDNGKLPDHVRDAGTRKPIYGKAREALEFAAELDPKSRKIKRLFARSQSVFGEYESAYQTVSDLISSASSGEEIDDESLVHLFHCWGLRVRVAFLWAERDLHNGVLVDEAARSRLKEAEADLDRCDTYLHTRQFENQDLKIYHVLHDRVRTMATSVEVDLKLSKTRSAERYIQKAEDVLAQLIECIKLRRLEAEVPPTTDLQDRLKGLKNELKLALQRPLRGETATDSAAPAPSVADARDGGR